MATFAHQFSCFFFTLLFICFLSEARKSIFFSKYVHLSKNTNTNYVSPAPAPAPLTSHISNAPTPMGSDYGYAPTPIESEEGTSSSLSEKNTILDNDEEEEEEEFSNEELSNESHEELNYEKSNSNSDTNANTYLDANSNNLSDDNGFETSNHEIYNNINGYDTNVGYTSEPEGMSDTRLVNNGKFYYNVGNENYVPSGDELSKRNNDEGGYNYGNYKKSKYEFDSMEEYEKQEGYPDVQQQFP